MDAAEPKLPGIIINDRYPAHMPEFCFNLSELSYGGSYGPERGRGKFLIDSDRRCWIAYAAGSGFWFGFVSLFRKRFRFEQVDTLEWTEIQKLVISFFDRFDEEGTKDVLADTAEEGRDAAAKSMADERSRALAEIEAAQDMEAMTDFLLQFD